jgi:hypothetical protein
MNVSSARWTPGIALGLWFAATLSSGCDRLNPLEYATYKRALASNTMPALTDFLAAYPRSRHRQEMAGALTQLEARIRRLHSGSFDHLSKQKVAEAAALLSELVRLSPNDQIALNNVALTALLKGDIERASELFGRTVDPTNADCCRVKDVVLFAVYSTAATSLPTGVLGAFLPADADLPAMEAIGVSKD